MSTDFNTRILVVDDNREAAELLSDLLVMEGFSTATAYDGYMALDVALSFAPHIVILDLNMPRFSGDEVAPTLRQLRQFEHVFIIALTGMNDSAARALTRRSGFDLHLAKPLQLPALRAALAQGRQSFAAVG